MDKIVWTRKKFRALKDFNFQGKSTLEWMLQERVVLNCLYVVCPNFRKM